MQQYEGLKHRNDFTDAQWLAHLLRLGILPEGSIYPKEERGVRDLLRKRMKFVQHRTSNLLSIQTQAARHLGHAWSGNRMKKLTSEEVGEQRKAAKTNRIVATKTVAHT